MLIKALISGLKSLNVNIFNNSLLINMDDNYINRFMDFPCSEIPLNSDMSDESSEERYEDTEFDPNKK